MKRTRRPRPPVTMPSDFNGFRFPPEVIFLAVRWYLRYGLVGRGRASRRRLSQWQSGRMRSRVKPAQNDSAIG